MRTNLGRPYNDRTDTPTTRFYNNDNSYDIYMNDYTVEIIQKTKHNTPSQRLVVQKADYQRFEEMLINNGFVQTSPT